MGISKIGRWKRSARATAAAMPAPNPGEQEIRPSSPMRLGSAARTPWPGPPTGRYRPVSRGAVAAGTGRVAYPDRARCPAYDTKAEGSGRPEAWSSVAVPCQGQRAGAAADCRRRPTQAHAERSKPTLAASAAKARPPGWRPSPAAVAPTAAVAAGPPASGPAIARTAVTPARDRARAGAEPPRTAGPWPPERQRRGANPR